ncbi:hypothetical protein SEPCBS119000_006285 [Sporothrix epigloea]|uniref:Transmembrane protein n=1 Tax=Sporothrix epigloea TaxID=1892477 RepID=A0ABP0E267_9PEZI
MANDDDDDAEPWHAAVRDRLKKWSWKSSKSKEAKETSSSTSSPGGLYMAPSWLPLAKIVMTTFGLNLLFLLIGLIVAGLVLGGTITIDAKAIGLTESLVLLSSIFGLAYMVVHMLAARRPNPVEGLTSKKRTSRHTRIIMLGRITAGLWAASLLAVAITLASLPAGSQASRSPLQAGLAACIMGCLDMAVVLLVVERTTQPFVLPWLTPPVPEAQTLAAKALIDEILGDGVSGHPYAGSEVASATEAETSAAATASRTSSEGDESTAVAPKQSLRVTLQDVPDGEDDLTRSTSTLVAPPYVGAELFGQPSSSTLVERHDLWNRVDEGNITKASSPNLPPHPMTFLTPTQQHRPGQLVPPIPPQHIYGMPAGAYIQPMPSPFQYYPPHPIYLSPAHMQTAPYPPTPPSASATSLPLRPPLYRAAGSGLPQHSYTPALPGTPTAVQPQYAGGIAGGEQSVPTAGLIGARPPPPPPVKGKRMFDKAVEGLKASEKRKEPIWDDYSTCRVPGSFVEM